jgi:hypothetical protein
LVKRTPPQAEDADVWAGLAAVTQEKPSPPPPAGIFMAEEKR